MARTVSCAQSLHGFVETSFFVVDDEGAFEGGTVAVVVADRFDPTVLLDDITKSRSSSSQSLLFWTSYFSLRFSLDRNFPPIHT